ncbi:MAG: metallophosphoesterase, partial [Bacteroidales bacterium]|nr:metallophosphoesterase [Bacteroidales bacterium]
MKTLKIISLVILLASCSDGLTRKDSSFVFVQITDPQFGFYGDTAKPFMESKLYGKAVAYVNQLHPAFVVITGDFVNDRNNKSQWDEFMTVTSDINPEIPLYYTPGNHDIGQAPAAGDIAEYKQKLGYDRFSFYYHDNAFIGLNSCIIKAGTEKLENEQLEWLTGELKKASKAVNTIVLCHHPFFISSPDEAESYSNIEPVKRLEYLELFKKYGVDAIFAGHYHNSGYGEYKGIKMITTSAVGKPLADTPSGIRVVTLSDKGINSTYLSLDSSKELSLAKQLE